MEPTGTVTVIEDNARVYSSANGAGTSQLLSFGTQWHYGSYTVDNQGRTWFCVGTNQWVVETEAEAAISSVVKTSGTCTVSSAGSANLYRSPNGTSVGRTLAPSSQWRYGQKATDIWGIVWFCVGYGQWVTTREVFDGNGGSTGGSRQEFLNYAIQISTGKGYSENGALRLGPNYFDCSGLVYTALQHFGVNIGVTSGPQYYATTPITSNELQPGDLVFYGVNGGQHVGIYSGNGEMWNAENERDGIGYSPVYDFGIDFAQQPFRRITQLG